MRFQPGIIDGRQQQFPVIEGTAQGNTGFSSTTSYNAALPMGVEEGDLLVVAFDGPNDSTMPAGWFLRVNLSGFRVFTRFAAGAEAAVIATTGGQSQAWRHIAYRISGAGASRIAAASASSLNLPSLAASWGAARNLWLAIGRTNYISSSPPAGFVMDEVVASGSVARLAAASRAQEAASQSGGQFTQTSPGGSPVCARLAVGPV